MESSTLEDREDGGEWTQYQVHCPGFRISDVELSHYNTEEFVN
jgi:hypothetical protein